MCVCMFGLEIKFEINFSTTTYMYYVRICIAIVLLITCQAIQLLYHGHLTLKYCFLIYNIMAGYSLDVTIVHSQCNNT